MDVWQWFMIGSAIMIVVWGSEEHNRAKYMKHFNGGTAFNSPNAFKPKDRSMAEITFDAFAGGQLDELQRLMKGLYK